MSFDSFHLSDADVWTEVEIKKIQSNGYVYAGRKYKDEEYEAKVFIKKRENSAQRIRKQESQQVSDDVPHYLFEQEAQKSTSTSIQKLIHN